MKLSSRIVALFMSLVMVVTLIPVFTIAGTATGPKVIDVDEGNGLYKAIRLDKPFPITNRVTKKLYSSAEDESLISKTRTDYAYKDYDKRSHSAGRKALYNKLFEICKEFYYSSNATIEEDESGKKYYIIDQFEFANTYGLTLAEMFEVYVTFKNDNPIFYFLANFVGYTVPDKYGNEYILVCTDSDYDTIAERKECNKILKDGIEEYAKVKEDYMGEAEIATAVHDKMTYYVDYAYDEEGNPSNDLWAHNVMGVFQYKSGVCESYARAYELILNYLGIENVFVTSDNHAWNMVKIGDLYYWVDCTWDARGDGCIYRYYNLIGSAEWDDHIPSSDAESGINFLYALPTNIATENAVVHNIYVTKNGEKLAYVDTMDEAISLVTDSTASYKFYLYNMLDYEITQTYFPASQGVEIISKSYIDRDDHEVNTDVSFNDSFNFYSNVTLTDVNISSSYNYYVYMANKNCASVYLNSNTLNINGKTYNGGKDYLVGGKTYDRVGVNLFGNAGSKIVVNPNSHLYLESDFVNVPQIEGSEVVAYVGTFTVGTVIVDDMKLSGDGTFTVSDVTASNIDYYTNGGTTATIALDSITSKTENGNVVMSLNFVDATHYPKINLGTVNATVDFHINGNWPNINSYASSIVSIGENDRDKFKFYISDENNNSEFYKKEDGKIYICDHSAALSPVSGQAETCYADGYKDLYQCSKCGTYFDDSVKTTKILDFESWKLNDGKVLAHHTGMYEYLPAKEETCFEDGNATVYSCSDCETKYFSDAEGTKEVAENSWVIPMHHSVINGICENCGAEFILETPIIKLSRVSGKPKISWSPIENATKYEVYRATSKTGTYTLLGTSTGTTYTNSGAPSGKTYYYKVKAITTVPNYVNSDFSEPSGFTTTCDAPSVTMSGVSGTTSSGTKYTGKPKLTWKAVTGASKYEVYRATSKTGTYSLLGTTTGTSYTNSGASAGKTYYYKVKAISKASKYANSAYSSIKSFTCTSSTPSVTIALSSNKPKLTWKAITGASKYEVYRATSKSGSYSKIATTTSKSYVDKKATKGKTYYYKVKAINGTSSYANSAYSSIKSIKSK